ncbi:SGNH/GDSL hydrolase family protein [Streptomyces sp. NPDC005318]|uniref:SGNH/GDSL hydrolase family protein n=1 Tax=Streptomyces sp. NPDC005318 TaxID=3157031 RepID=UPI0033A9214B
MSALRVPDATDGQPVTLVYATGDARTHQVVTWGAGMQETTGPVAGQTVRNIVHTSVGGDNLRVSLSNVAGNAPVTFDGVTVGVQADGANLVEGSNRQVTFGGSTSVTIPPGAEVLGDPIPGNFPPEQNLAVSVHTSDIGGAVTGHNMFRTQFSYISTDGNHAADESASAFTTSVSRWFWVAGLIVDVPKEVDTLVAFGDSITDGYDSTPNANNRYPDHLARRLLAGPEPHRFGISNQGISGNKVLADGKGDSAQARFARDVLSQPHVSTVIMMEGGNDIGADNASAQQLISAYQQMVTRARSRGICVIGGTLTPFEGSGYYSPERETVRQAVNDWIRTSGAFDALVDFDKATRDPERPTRLLPAYDSGLHLHLNDAGYRAMANAVNLQDLACKRI